MARQNHLDALMDAELTWKAKTYALPKKLPKALSAAEIKAKKERQEEEKKEEEEKKRKEREKIKKKQAKMLKRLNGELFGDDSDSDSDSDEEEEEEEEEDPKDDTSNLWTHSPQFYLETNDPAIKSFFKEDATPKPSGSANPSPPHGNPTMSEKPKCLHLSKIEEATRRNANPSPLHAKPSPLYVPRGRLPQSYVKPSASEKPKEEPKTSMNLHMPKIEEAIPEPSANANPSPPPANTSPLYAPSDNLPLQYASPYGNPRESIKQKEKPKNPMHSNIPKEESPRVGVPKNTSKMVKSQEKSPTLKAASIAANLSYTPNVDPKSENAPRSSRKAEKNPAKEKPVVKTAASQVLGTKYMKKYSWMAGGDPVYKSGTKHTPIALDEEEKKETTGTQTPIQQVTGGNLESLCRSFHANAMFLGAIDANVQNNSNNALRDQEGAPATQNHNAEESGNDVEADLEEAFAEDEELDRQRQLEKDRAFEEAFEEEEKETEPENTPSYGGKYSLYFHRHIMLIFSF